LRDGMLSHFTSTGDGSVWTATLSAPTRNVTSSNNTFRVNMAGVNDRAGNAGEGGVPPASITASTPSPGAPACASRWPTARSPWARAPP
ncbi:Ig-like domain-containing protein, partial [Verminephrobacter aporrectodeae]|uniref:Ig-like domain-containing protein n=1 Tax=Verminephrobacter aporrectodeae TaxID=1110389 RepID=UPI001F41FF7E